MLRVRYRQNWVGRGRRINFVVKLGHTDSTATTFAGTLAFVEHTFGLPALNSIYGSAYDYRNAFCYQPMVTGCVAAGAQPVHLTFPATNAAVACRDVRLDRVRQ